MIKKHQGFTLIELLVVITIIAVLMGMLFPVIGSVRDSARKAVASTTAGNIVLAVNGFYTEYGVFPPSETMAEGTSATDISNAGLINILRARETSGGGEDTGDSNLENPRLIRFLTANRAKNPDNPRDGVVPAGSASGYPEGTLLDPWGNPYGVIWDEDYDGEVEHPVNSDTLQLDVIAWSVGKDGTLEVDGRDDVTSWE
jgi:prepilin-type N-terminal cleavage/methylation domain-containing protein